MENKKLIRFVESFLFLPFVTMTMPLGNVPMFQSVSTPIVTALQAVSTQTEYNTNAVAAVADTKAAEAERQLALQAKDLEVKAGAIDVYFKKHQMPLFGTGKKMVEEAEKNNLDWRLLPAIAVRESTGGKHACTSVPNSFFGWGSCTIGFSSKGAAIEAVAENLNTHYSGNTRQILQKYNPPSVVPEYADQVMGIMNQIGTKDMPIILDASVSSYAPSVQTE